MEKIKNYSYLQLRKLLIGKTVNFISDCELFPNFNVTGKVISIKIANQYENLITVKRPNQKMIDIGTNMKNLQFQVL